MWIARQVKHLHVKWNALYLRRISADVAEIWVEPAHAQTLIPHQFLSKLVE